MKNGKNHSRSSGSSRTASAASSASASTSVTVPAPDTKLTATPERDELVYDWNRPDVRRPFISQPFFLVDESLRDGVQSPSVVDPTIEDKLKILQLMEDLGIGRVDIGLPGAGKRAYDDVLRLARYIVENKLKIKPYCAARTVQADIAPIADVMQKTGLTIEAYTFIGSSPIRQYAENWDLAHLLKTSTAAIEFCNQEGVPNCFVTEDTTRSHPRTLDPLFRSAIDHGTHSLVLCDTVGHATPDGTAGLVRWTRGLLRGVGAEHVRVEWHGHNDRGLAVTNALFALEAGADGVHGCALGIGERVGNAAIDQLLLNLRLLGAYDHDLSHLVEYVQTVSRAVHVPIPKNYPLSGEDAFRTATGVHAAAIVKAQRLGDTWLADRVYSGVPAGEFGKRQTLEIGHMSGMSNVVCWLGEHGIETDELLAQAILQRAKTSDRVLTEAEVLRVVNQFQANKGGGTGGKRGNKPVRA
jgi:2-isopropylmalate synthase